VITAQPSVDVIMLSALAGEAAVGWYGAACKLVGMLLFPATILGTALYPTLGRLHAEGSDRYGELVRSGLRPMVLLGTGAAMSTYLFADEMVAIVYGLRAFAPTAAVLKMFAPYIALVFVDIAFGAALIAANAQTAWIVAKIVSLLLAALLNLALIPAFDAAFGNGALGSAAATAAAEVVMFVTGVMIIPLPRAALVLALGKDLARAGAAAATMAAAVWLLRDAAPLLGIAAGLLTYLLSSVLLGGIRKEDVEFLRAAVRSR
jgi:O-antigen/teichoic acid export membrane protein